jgi:pyruvate,water dikinase
VDHRLAPIPLEAAIDERLFGGKAVSLGEAIRQGLPVPRGIALSVTLVADIASGRKDAVAGLLESRHLPPSRAAVRSSAVGEDSKDASFAGQHATHLNVGRAGLADAVRAVWASGRSEAALAYRAQRGIPGDPAVGVVVQGLIAPLAAGVLFTRNPMTGADERMIEAAWGLGEAVVAGRVVPDQFRLGADGRVLEQTPGDKDVQIVHHDHEGVREVELDDHRRQALCLTLDHLQALFDLSERCRRVWGPNLDLEWAIDVGGACHLLQARPITTRVGGA